MVRGSHKVPFQPLHSKALACVLSHLVEVRELKWEEQRTMKSYVDKLDRKIFPYIECEGYEDVYPTYNSCSFSEEFYQELSFASKELFEIFEKTFNIFRNCSCDFLKQMEMPKKLYDFMRVENNLNKPSFLSRFDFIVDEQYGLHVVELNADTPCALVEAYYANKVANDYLHKKDANAKYYNDLKTMFKQIFIMNRESLPDGSNICFSCFTDFIEDCGNAKFLYENAKQALKEMNYNYNVFFVDFKESDNSYDKSYVVEKNKFDEGLEYYIELYVDNQLTEDKQYIMITKKYRDYGYDEELNFDRFIWRIDKSSFRGYVNIDEFKTILNLLNIK